jgi:hypothetical protein
VRDSSGSGGKTIANRGRENSSDGGSSSDGSSSSGGSSSSDGSSSSGFVSACIKPGGVHYRVVARAALKAAGTR